MLIKLLKDLDQIYGTKQPQKAKKKKMGHYKENDEDVRKKEGNKQEQSKQKE